MKEKMINCSNCGAKIVATSASCSHCGAMNYSGARREYMNELEGMREELQDIGEEAQKNAGKKTVLQFFGILAIGTALMVIVIMWALSHPNRLERDTSMENDYYDRLIWQDKYYPQLEEAYESQDFDTVLEIYRSKEAGNGAIYQWEHYGIIDFYKAYLNVLDGMKDFEGRGKVVYSSQLTDAVMLAGYYKERTRIDEFVRMYNRAAKMTERDYQLIQSYGETAAKFLFDAKGMSQQLIDECAEYSTDTYGFSSSKCREWFDNREESGNGM